ncbi:methylmalonyl-CoA mutase small subunit [Variibacter gotjawalensis]|uniref:Methylmalonyl-CoA mutase small subunit n=1 Tax=Variibacter gotjawalensis TaxID=1333996 RepID=A0A0S3PZB7_9BRAD|nr:methylmalonyl-CoA mutase subunit beta [Variibacter gotjawalensis]NIK47119.1 methylmalonyl-CoA mutase [Variibacter gotjawalensis]RZS49021.1 heterodimeric methylmalonyl-CoA mutase small subunit [Variibacter gotjawalensis]BAT61281.1 methylmalonyl-CoA mutase small subunit [Variibacter gotjawalensis]
MNKQELPLAQEFPAATQDQWRTLVDGVLKGKPFEKLTSRTYDGIAIEPLYGRAENAQPVAARAAGAPWQLITRIEHPDPAAANAQALHDLENGATGLMLPITGAVGAYGFGIPAARDAIAQVLDGIFLDAGVAIEFDIPADAHKLAFEIAEIVTSRKIAPHTTNIIFGIDAFGAAAARGKFAENWDATGAALARLAQNLNEQSFVGPFLAADGRAVHAAGGSEAQELAFTLAAGVALLRAFEKNGVALDEARALISFRLAADADELLTVAKLRALRKLWARVQEACELRPKPARLTAETAWRMLTKRDPNVNMLRDTMAVFSAAVGGADAIAVLPFTQAIGLPDPFARRVARNTQLILAEESNLAKVADPAAGAGAFETITAELCAAAWKLFQEIEAEGGLAVSLQSGSFQKKVEAARAARAKAAGSRRDPLTGTSEFPLLTENQPNVIAPIPVVDHPAHAFPRLAPHRVSEPFEVLRDKADTASAKGARPKVFLANLGKPASFLARATFAKSFFEVGGIEALGNEGFAADGTTDTAALTAAFKSSGAEIACICGSDESYGQEAAAAAEALREAGAKAVYLAGRAGDLEAALTAAGVNGYVYAGADVLATLTAIHDNLS